MKIVHGVALFGIAMLAMAIARPALAQEEPAVRVAALVSRLGDDSFSSRQLAEQALLEEGPLADAHLQQALASSSPEVRQRAENILRRRRANAVWEPTMLSFPEGSATFDELKPHITAALGKGNVGYFVFPRDPEKNGHATRVKLPAGEMPYMQAVSLVCDGLGIRLNPPSKVDYRGPQPGRFVSSKPSQPVAGRAFSGPLMLEIVSVKQDHATQELQLDFRLQWEPKFELVSYSGAPLEIELIGNDGQRLAGHRIPLDWHTVGLEAKPIRATATIPLEKPVEGLIGVKVEWALSAAAVSDTLVIDRAETGHRLVSRAGEIIVEQWHDQQATIGVENIRSWPEPAEALLRSYQWTYNGETPMVLGKCELTEAGGRWQLPAAFGWNMQQVQLAYRTEFTRKNVEFEFEKIVVLPRFEFTKPSKVISISAPVGESRPESVARELP